MSVVAFPRTRQVTRPSTGPALRPVPRSAPAHRSTQRRTRQTVLSRISRGQWSAILVFAAMAIALAANMFQSQGAMQLHNLQSQLLQEQSTYAQQLGVATNYSAPGYVATQAGSLHLASPVSVTQIPSASLDTPLPLPKFVGYAPVVPRTRR